MNPIVAVVGLPGAGKSTVTEIFKEEGYHNIYIPEIIFEELDKRGLEVNEENERLIREEMREKKGISAIEHTNREKVQNAVLKGPVTLESFYTWESYMEYKKVFGDSFIVVAVLASPKTREKRLVKRKERSLTVEQVQSRTWSQISNLHQAGPIAIADYFIISEKDIEYVQNQATKIARAILSQE